MDSGDFGSFVTCLTDLKVMSIAMSACLTSPGVNVLPANIVINSTIRGELQLLATVIIYNYNYELHKIYQNMDGKH